MRRYPDPPIVHVRNDTTGRRVLLLTHMCCVVVIQVSKGKAVGRRLCGSREIMAAEQPTLFYTVNSFVRAGQHRVGQAREPCEVSPRRHVRRVRRCRIFNFSKTG